MALVHYPYVPTPDSSASGSRDRLGEYDGRLGGEEYFDDMVAYLDKCIGRIASALDDAGVRENTLFLFTCDNGCTKNIVSYVDGQKIVGGKGTMPDAGTRVALIANWPAKVEPGTKSNALVDFSDFLPTLVDTVGATAPQRQPVDGYSFLPVLTGKSTGERDWVFCHYTRNGVPKEPENLGKKAAILKNEEDARGEKRRWAGLHELTSLSFTTMAVSTTCEPMF